MEEIGGKRLDVRFRYPRRAEIGVDVAGQHVLRLHFAQRLGVAGILRAGALGGGELLADVAGEIRVGGLPGLGFGVAVDEIAQLGDDLLLGLAVERGDERQVHCTLAVEGNEQPLLGGCDGCDGRRAADDVLVHDGRLGGLARHLVIVFQRHDEHRVGVLAEFHQIGHAADDGAFGGLAEGGLVDGAVGTHKQVIGAVERLSCVVAVGLGPALVLGLQDAAGDVAQAHQGGKPAARERAVGLEHRAAIGHGNGLSADRLAEDRALSPMKKLPSVIWCSGGGGVKAGTASSLTWDACAGANSGRRRMASPSCAARSPLETTL